MQDWRGRFEDQWVKWTDSHLANDVEARHEHMIRATILLTGMVLAGMLPLFLAGWLVGLLPLEALLLVLFFLVSMTFCWWMVLQGRLIVASTILPVLFFILGAYGSFTAGLTTTLVLSYAVSILMVSLFVGGKSRWEALISSVGAHIFLGVLHDQKPLSQIAISIINSTAFLTAIALLQWYATHRLKLALKNAEKTEEKLRNEIAEREAVEARLQYLSSHDTLTGLFNRFFFEAEFERLAGSRQMPVSVVMADLDDLKEVNDLHGHAFGDKLLKAVSDVLRQTFRVDDVVARIGGDEFAVLLPHTDASVLRSIHTRLLENIQRHNTVNPQSPIRLSVGIATGRTNDDLRAVLKLADDRMYENKKAHRLNRVG